MDSSRFDVQQDKIGHCNWTFLTLCLMATERYSIRKLCGTNKTNPLEIDHVVRTTSIYSYKHFPLHPLQQVEVS